MNELGFHVRPLCSGLLTIYKMKYENGRTYRRRIGQPRKDQSIYGNLGHPHDITGKTVIFVCKEEKAYSLTKGKEYVVLKYTNESKRYNWDRSLAEKVPDDKVNKRVTLDQSEDYMIQIINDKGNKREYSHTMFKREQGQ